MPPQRPRHPPAQADVVSSAQQLTRAAGEAGAVADLKRLMLRPGKHEYVTPRTPVELTVTLSFQGGYVEFHITAVMPTFRLCGLDARHRVFPLLNEGSVPEPLGIIAVRRSTAGPGQADGMEILAARCANSAIRPNSPRRMAMAPRLTSDTGCSRSRCHAPHPADGRQEGSRGQVRLCRLSPRMN
jgi:hypothetical protein